jgi:hypothetical protein
MLRLLGMTKASSNNGQMRSDNNDNKENKDDKENNNMSPPEVLATSSPSPEEEPSQDQEGDDDTTGLLQHQLLPSHIFCETNVTSTPSPSSISSVSRIDSTVESKQSTVLEDPHQPYLECSRPLNGVNLSHVKQEEQEEGDGSYSCASASEFEVLGDATEEALQDRHFLLANNEDDKMSDGRENKLCDNDLAPKRGETGYDPAYTYDYIFCTIIDNLNSLTGRAELDLCGNETTYGHMGCGELGSGLVARIMGKPGISKGGQIVLVSDASRNRPRIYMHRHKCYEKYDGWNKQGPAEVRHLMETIVPRIKGEREVPGIRQIFTARPHSTWDNYFSGDQIFDWLGQKGFAATMTFRCDCLPSEVLKEYLHAKKTVSDTRSRAARFNEAVTAVKQTLFTLEDTVRLPFKRIHVSFQSTLSTNISTVNALNSNKIFVVKKERGQGASKRKWAIQMNEARQLYLKMYGRIIRSILPRLL